MAFVPYVGVFGGRPADECTPGRTGTHDGDGAEQDHDEDDDQDAEHDATVERAGSGTRQVDPGFDLDLGADG